VTNSGAKVTEFYVYAAGDRVMGEVENITPGLSRELRVELPAGTYQTACKPGMIGQGIRAALTVSGSSEALTTDAALSQATVDYTRYITAQSEALVQKTGDFVTAVKAGDVQKSKDLFPIARTYYERIEPVAEIFGDLDPKIDGREDDATKELPFSGFHKIEKDLWVANDISKDGPVADQLLADVNEVVTRAKDEKLSPLQLANGAKELLDEVATGKITGEEDTFSHTDLSDFKANVDGAQKAFELLNADKTVKTILVNIFGGIMRCDVIAMGIINAAKNIGIKKPIIIRLKGTNVEEAKKLIEDSGLRMLTADDLQEAASKAVRVVQIISMAEDAKLDGEHSSETDGSFER